MTPELEQPNDTDTEPTDGDGPGVQNMVSGVVGAVVQAGVVHGDVHLHSPPPLPVPVAPRQLPAAPARFVGRVAELAGLDRTLAAATAPDGRDSTTRGPTCAGSPANLAVTCTTMVVSAIGGAGGIGKTWLALAWAHRHLDRFPDGQLFVDLHGFSPTQEPMAPGAAVRGFLDALEVDPGRIPTDLDAQAALYRSLVASRRMLIMLDNAATAEQVVPLLPGSPTCTVLITCRTRLASLIDRHGARHLTLDILTQDEARALLAARLSADRIAAEVDAVDELIALCGSYPLALSITARNAATRPSIPLSEVAAELRELGFEMLEHDTDSVASLPCVLSWSLRRLTDEHRSVFGLLGIAPGPDTTQPAVAALTGLPSARARKALSALEEASLLERRPGGRYVMHDLVRNYAATTARTTLSDSVREAALLRVIDFHLHSTIAANRLLDHHRLLVLPDPPTHAAKPFRLPDAAAAMAWLRAEHAVLLGVQRVAAVLGQYDIVWRLAQALDTFLLRQGHLCDALVAWRAALDAAAHLTVAATRSCAYRSIGRACSRLSMHEEAIGYLSEALGLAMLHRDRTEQARTHRALASAWERRGDDRRALDHARHALDLHRVLDQPVQEATALNQVGWYAARLGDFGTARGHCRAALALYQHHHHLDGEADALDSLGFIAYNTGDYRQAVSRYKQALTLRRTLGNNYRVADTLDRVGHLHLALRQYEQARAVWLEALELYREQGRDAEAERAQQQLDKLSHSNSFNDIKE